ncbi:hypothetical protein [Bradyrhizobium sp. 18]|uniref:hypothetical protein n=1 Tax=Bradyrhizobium sp. 18 TaxID=2782657 RepID=UPI001FF9FA75|nr:hypothetical protein [Bradyrhizobium sp. 18]MCK1507183.1 hypothetical protein [Bradyrhizobium sp. 18]
MPMKRKIRKRRTGDAAEVKAWAGLFYCGYDYFRDLKPYGFTAKDADRAARVAAPEAWKRLGKTYLETLWVARFKGPGQRQVPWAVEEFGFPEGYNHAD